MPVLMNIDEVFAIAVQIESNGESFYRTAAKRQKDAATARCLNDLAAMETGHRETFEAMRRAAAQQGLPRETTDLYNEGNLFLAAIADGYRIEGAPRIADSFTGGESLDEVLRTAIDLEKRSILFYIGLRDLVSKEMGRDKLDRIIEEEKAHVVALTQRLKAATGR